MATTLVFALIFFPICWLYGWLAVKLIEKIFGIESQEIDPLLYMLAGLILLTSLGAFFTLFLALNWQAIGLIILGAVAILMVGSRRRILVYPWQLIDTRSLAWPVWVLLGVVFVSILVNAVKLPANPDTALYHAQTIHWIEAYRVVPGLGNLQSRFAYNSDWLVLNALFSFAFIGLGSLHLVAAMLYFVVCADFLRGVANWFRGNFSLANCFRVICLPLTFYLVGAQVSSPGTDVPVILIAWCLAAAWLERPHTHRASLTTPDLVIVASSVFLVTLKLSAAPLILLSVLVLWGKKINWGDLFILAAMAGFILLPWMMRSLILSGYLVFPVSFPNIFTFDWKIPPADVAEASKIIRAWARIDGGNVDVVAALPVQGWAKYWFFDHSANQQVVLALAGVSPLGVAITWLWKRIRRISLSGEEKRLLGMYSVALAGAIFWLFSAPDLRFGYTYVILLIGLPAAYLLSWLAKLPGGWLAFLRYGLVALLVIYQVFFLVRSLDLSDLAGTLVLPTDYRELPSEPCSLENGTILCAAEISYTDCWYNPFPCIPKPVSGVYLRGDNWQDGFTVNPPDKAGP